VALVKCEDCGRDVSTDALACPNCGRPMDAARVSTAAPASAEPQRQRVNPLQPETSTQSTGPKKGWFRRHPILAVVLTLIVLAIIGSAISNGNNSGSSGVVANDPTAAAPTPSAPSGSDLTTEQQQAVQAARNYLSLGTGFSRAGLIQQLSSSAGSGFPRDAAIFAVDYLNIDWDEQAVESAKNYMSLGTGFSRAGLIQQLSSSAGSGFTHAQAVYAADQVGL
jgi:hypothetical protein